MATIRKLILRIEVEILVLHRQVVLIHNVPCLHRLIILLLQMTYQTVLVVRVRALGRLLDVLLVLLVLVEFILLLERVIT